MSSRAIQDAKGNILYISGTGTGAPGDPFIPDVVFGTSDSDPTTAIAIQDPAGNIWHLAAVGAGTVASPFKVLLGAISTDADNALELGSDDKLFATSGGGAEPAIVNLSPTPGNVSNTTTETEICSLTVPAEWVADGKRLRLQAFVTMGAPIVGPCTVIIRFYSGTVEIGGGDMQLPDGISFAASIVSEIYFIDVDVEDGNSSYSGNSFIASQSNDASVVYNQVRAVTNEGSMTGTLTDISMTVEMSVADQGNIVQVSAMVAESSSYQ